MTPTTTLPPHTVQEILTRAGRPDFDRWTEQVSRCGHCSRPVRLRGHVEHRTTAGQRIAYSTDAEPDQVLLIRCGNRRAAVCPSCSHEYAGDMWQLLYAGAAGGRKGIPESIRSHPLVFLTLTAPGFGPVHTTRADRSGGSARCRPARGTPRLCPHGRPSWCTTIHAEDDPRLGHSLCPDCYDYPGHIAFNWHAPELWRRFTITLRRVLARQAGLTAGEFARRCRVSFVKVAEFQRRGVVHFHSLIRLDGPGEDYQPPQLTIDAHGWGEAIRQAATQVRLTVKTPDGPDLVLCFGAQIDIQTVNSGPGGELTPEHAARYIAKYATKSAENFGLGERRITPEASRCSMSPTTLISWFALPGSSGNIPPTTDCAGGFICLAFEVISLPRAAATPPPSAPSAANAAPTANAKPPSTSANSSMRTPPWLSRIGNSPELAISPPEISLSLSPPPPEHANNDKPPATPHNARATSIGDGKRGP
jgi:hypothetical protein